MSKKLIIRGCRPLEGRVAIQGSKNTTLPLIAACLLSTETCELKNVPTISDVDTMISIALGVGAKVEWDRAGHRLTINARSLSSDAPDESLSRKLRGSILFSGALLSRLRRASIPYPGGDAIGARPLRTHFRALEALGVKIQEGSTIHLDASALKGSDVVLEESSVTATENTILASVLAPGKTILRFAAYEPHVQELVRFLQSLGARILWPDSFTLIIEGVERLKGGAFRINPDELEISGFAALAAATRSQLAIDGIEPRYLDAFFLQLGRMGVSYEVSGSTLGIKKPASSYQAFRLQSGLYPKLGSDHLPPFAVLATQAEGSTLIHDWMYDGRFRYLDELGRMGANCVRLDPHRALIHGPTPLYGTVLTGLDIRSGMALVIAGLVAQGETTISDIQHLDRGYERLDERLREIGADIHRVNDETRMTKD